MKKVISVILSVTTALSIAGVVLSKDKAETDLLNDEVVCEDGLKVNPDMLVLCSDWAAEDIKRAEEMSILNGNYEFTRPINREQFCELIYNYCASADKLADPDVNIVFNDTDNEKIHVLNKMGIIKGKTATEFAPEDLLSREEAATILLRMIDGLYPDRAVQELYYEFADSDSISDWAMESVQIICNMKVMKGVGDNSFAPKAYLTAEQAITMLVRVHDGFNIEKKESEWDNFTFADKLNANMPEDSNYMFSPLSIKMALMMAANGASGDTLDEILEATGIEDLNGYNESVRLMLDKYSESDILTFNVANSIWMNSDRTSQKFSKDYEKVLSNNFGATSDVVTDKTAVSKINNWVNDKTEGKIPEIITEDNKEFMSMLINAVYFKGRWRDTFNKSATQKDLFTSRDGSQKDIDFMNRRAWMGYSDEGGVEIVSVPYLTRHDVFDEKGRHIETKILDGVDISMYLMMSDESFSAEEVLNKAEMKSTYMDLSIPKFNIEYSTGLNEILKTIGINKAFNEGAEFNKMFDKGNMWIGTSIHKTYINVDEEGTEAAAVTAMAMAGSSLPPEPIEVKFNKPFTFVIKDNANGEILFMGEYSFAK